MKLGVKENLYLHLSEVKTVFETSDFPNEIKTWMDENYEKVDSLGFNAKGKRRFNMEDATRNAVLIERIRYQMPDNIIVLVAFYDYAPLKNKVIISFNEFKGNAQTDISYYIA